MKLIKIYEVRLNRFLFIFILIITILFVFIRLIKLNSDFPQGITSSGALYTDEGWYSNAAVRYMISENWYSNGDFNPSINQPFGQFLQLITLSILGVSLFSARFTTVIAFILLLVFIFFLIKIFEKRNCNFSLFFTCGEFCFICLFKARNIRDYHGLYNCFFTSFSDGFSWKKRLHNNLSCVGNNVLSISFKE